MQGDLFNFSPPVSGGGCWGGGGGHVPWNCPLLDPRQVEDLLLQGWLFSLAPNSASISGVSMWAIFQTLGGSRGQSPRAQGSGCTQGSGCGSEGRGGGV